MAYTYTESTSAPSFIKNDKDILWNHSCSYLDIVNYPMTNQMVKILHADREAYYSTFDYYPEPYPYWQSVYEFNGKIVLIILSGNWHVGIPNHIQEIIDSDNFVRYDFVNVLDENRHFTYYVNTKVRFIMTKSARNAYECL